MERQQTLNSGVTVNGRGLHTGSVVSLQMLPSEENTGILFCRTDIPDSPLVKADANLVTDTSRGTTLEYQGVKVYTTEHLLAALTALNVDNALIELNGPEVPILDGSARYWVEAINSVGVCEQNAERKYYKIQDIITYVDAENEIEMIALPADTFKVTVLIDFKTKVLGKQYATIESLDDFVTEIAPCRTFVFLHELDFLLKNNLIRGGDLDNALVFVEKLLEPNEMSHLAKLFNKTIDDLKVEEGVLNNVKRYFSNEPARHKLLDVVGDLRLVGMPLKGHFILKRPGHKSNVALAKLIKKQIMENSNGVPVYNPDVPPIYDINAIKTMLPHRHPFLLIDKIIDVTDTSVVGIKNVTMNEPFFEGHFPDEPVMPGVLIVEAMGQTGGILALRMVEDPEKYSTYFVKFDNVKFRSKVVPGDTLILKMELSAPIRRGLVQMHGTVYVGSKIAVEADLMAQIAKNKE